MTRTAASGEIDCLDVGGFGTVIITRAVTLYCSGVGSGGGGILSGSGSAITVNAGASDVVVIDGLDIDGFGSTGTAGITFVSGGSLIVRNTVIRNFARAGIEFSPAADASLTVDNTTITNVGHFGGYAAVNIAPTSAAVVRASVSRSQFSNNAFGVVAEGNKTTGSVFLGVRDTNITNTTGRGVYVINSGTALFAAISLDGVMVSGSMDCGLFANGTHARILVNNSSIIDNVGGLVPVLGGTIISFGNNRVSTNGNDGAFTGTTTIR